MTVADSQHTNPRGTAKRVVPTAVPGTRAKPAGRRKLVEILRSAEASELSQASVRLEFKAARDAELFRKQLIQLRQDDRQFGEHLSVQEAGTSVFIVYNFESSAGEDVHGPRRIAGSMRARVQRKELLRPAEFAEARGVSKQAVSKAQREKRIFYVEVDGAQYVPQFYLDEQLERRQIEQITRDLGDLPGPSKLQFFVNPKHSLGGETPLKALSRGKFEQVRASARGFAER